MGRRNGVALIALALAAFGAAAGCASEDDAGGGGPGRCEPNSLHACLCPDQSVGQQVCALDGASLGICMCGTNAGTSGGAAGSGLAGTAATAGSGGVAGPGGGVAGTGGGVAGTSAGAAGTAGSGEVDAGPMQDMDAATVPAGDEVPDSAHCAPVAAWDPEWIAFEDEVLRLVNQNRAKGWNCDTEGQFGATTALTTNKELRCAARLHSLDMNERNYFAHDAPGGATPKTRMDAAGYVGTTWGENIAKGQSTPAQVVQGWMDSDGHCANIMSPMFKEIGVGFYEGEPTSQYFNENLYWTQNFGAPCSQSWCM